jgi:aspartate dehydrogenase
MASEMKKKLKIGIIGCGTIGSQLAEAVEKRFSQQTELFALCDIDKVKAQGLKDRVSSGARVLSVSELIENCDLIIEAAQALVSFEIAEEALKLAKDVMVMSVGGILDGYERLIGLAEAKGGRIYLPSGALCGLDAVKSASMAKIDSVTLITRKPPKGLAGAPYLIKNNIDLTAINRETVVFEGNASEAVKGFPKNVNVCAVLSLAGIGAEKTKVKIVTSPDYKTNSHEIEVKGDFGKLAARTDNLPSPANPRTSYLASLSAIATLKNILGMVKIGT